MYIREYTNVNEHINVLVIKRMKIKATIRCHYTSMRMTKTKELTKPSFGEDRKQLEFSSTAGGNIDTLWITAYQYLLKQTYVSV